MHEKAWHWGILVTAVVLVEGKWRHHANSPLGKRKSNIQKTKQEKSARALQDDLQRNKGHKGLTNNSWRAETKKIVIVLVFATCVHANYKVGIQLSSISLSFANLRQHILSRNCKIVDKMVLNFNCSYYSELFPIICVCYSKNVSYETLLILRDRT